MANKRSNSWTGIIIKTFTFLVLISLNLGTALSQDPPAPANPAPTSNAPTDYHTFNVKDYLSIDKQNSNGNIGLTGTQAEGYLNKENENPVGAFILQIINLVALTAASMSFLAVVIAGFLMMSAAGNENQLNRGKDILTKAIFGLVITLSAYFIVAFVQNLLFETVAQ